MDRYRATPMPIDDSNLPVLWCASCIILSCRLLVLWCASCITLWYNLVQPGNHTATTPYGWPMVCQLYHTVIHSNAGWVYDYLVVQECMIVLYTSLSLIGMGVARCRSIAHFHPHQTPGTDVLECMTVVYSRHTTGPADGMCHWYIMIVQPVNHTTSRHWSV